MQIYILNPSGSPVVLIETYWNVNKESVLNVVVIRDGLNRNILECKFVSTLKNVQRIKSLNRNILECKLEAEVDSSIPLPVLIETYWNVNTSSSPV